jgi:hypothetical protein
MKKKILLTLLALPPIGIYLNLIETEGFVTATRISAEAVLVVVAALIYLFLAIHIWVMSD